MDDEPAYNGDCNGKAAYSEYRLAAKAAKRHRGLTVYKCETCRQYHIGGHIRFTGGKFKRPRPMRLG